MLYLKVNHAVSAFDAAELVLGLSEEDKVLIGNKPFRAYMTLGDG